MTAVFYPAVFHPEETGYSVTIPDIEGCFTQGETMDEAVAMAQDAIGLMLEDCEVCPKPSLPSAIHVDTGDFIAMIPFDMEEYQKQFKPVKRPCLFPVGSTMPPNPHISTFPAFCKKGSNLNWHDLIKLVT